VGGALVGILAGALFGYFSYTHARNGELDLGRRVNVYGWVLVGLLLGSVVGLVFSLITRTSSAAERRRRAPSRDWSRRWP
jgi:hypothetical protein